jgi:hypothetical protein
MPNWCNNRITFDGNQNNLYPFKNDFKESVSNEVGFNLLEGIGDYTPQYFFFNFDEVEDSMGEYTFTCDTKWAPPLIELQNICKKYNITCRCEYEEWGMGFGGVCNIDTDGRMEDSQFPDNEVTYNNTSDDEWGVEFRGERYESIYECFAQWVDANGL